MSEHEHLEVKLAVNGRTQTRTVSVRESLADFLRDELGLTGTHLGCEHGVCGACTVLLDGVAVRSCIMLAVQADGSAVTTIEGVGDGENLDAVQTAFWEHHALQCGFCTPAMVLAATELLQRHPDPSDEEIRRWMSGNLCRCTGYQFIVDAVRSAAQTLRESG